MHPKTVDLLRKAEEAKDGSSRGKLEREAVQAYFAEMAHFWTEDQVLLWQRSNPVGTEWMCEFARVLSEPKPTLDPVNYELALNWIRRGYNSLTAAELADALRQVTKEKLRPATVKKRRERLGLTTKRPPGPPPKKR